MLGYVLQFLRWGLSLLTGFISLSYLVWSHLECVLDIVLAYGKVFP